jgi:adenylylsulfate kinase-like enzyme
LVWLESDTVGVSIPVLWLSGPPGVGKTAVAWEIYRRLQRAGADPAYVDVDQLGMCSPPLTDDPDRHTLKARNVAALRANFTAAGARTLIVSGVVDAQRGPDIDTLGGTPVVARLRADPDALRARLRRRRGSFAQHEAAVEEAQALDRSAFANRCIDTSGLSIDDAATRALRDIGDSPPAGKERSDSSSSDDGTGAHGGGEVLFLVGTTGVGKSTVGFRAYLEVLRSGGHAAYVDVDQIGFCSTAPSDHSLRARNLAALWTNFHDAGARLAVVVGRVFTRSEALLYEQALPRTRLSWFRLRAGDAELTRRILSRSDGGSWPEPGDPLRDRPPDELLAVADRAIAAGHLIDRHDVGLRIDIDCLDIEDAAVTLLRLARWPAGGGDRTRSS